MEMHLLLKKLFERSGPTGRQVGIFKKIYKQWRMVSSPWRIYPGCIIIGAQKAGTTSLYNDLIKHPQILPPLNKEVHYLDYQYFRGDRWYRSNFPLSVRQTVLDKVNQCRHLGLEASPYYLFHPAVPARAAKLGDQMKYIAILRDPVTRAVSHYYHELRRGRETLPMIEAFRNEESRLADAVNIEEERRMLIHRNYSYKSRGRYAEQLRSWFDHVGRDNVLVIISEAYFHNSREEYSRALAFLGIKDYPLTSYAHEGRGSYRQIDDEARAYLTAYFLPFNRELKQLLGNDDIDQYWPVT